MTVTAERVFLIYMPTRARTVTSLNLARVVMATQWLVLTALEMHTFWSLGERYTILPDGTKQLFSACSIATSKFKLFSAYSIATSKFKATMGDWGLETLLISKS